MVTVDTCTCVCTEAFGVCTCGLDFFLRALVSCRHLSGAGCHGGAQEIRFFLWEMTVCFDSEYILRQSAGGFLDSVSHVFNGRVDLGS